MFYIISLFKKPVYFRVDLYEFNKRDKYENDEYFK